MASRDGTHYMLHSNSLHVPASCCDANHYTTLPKWLFPTTGMCSGQALQTCVCSQTSQTSQTCLRLPASRPWCHWTGSACSGLRSHRYPIIAQNRSTELCWSSAALLYVLTIVSSCSAGLCILSDSCCMLLYVFKCPCTCLLFLSSTSWSLGQVSSPVQVVVVCNANLVTGTDHLR
jgi:hypothetical protein